MTQEEEALEIAKLVVSRLPVKLHNGTVIEKDVVDLSKTVNFLSGVKKVYTDNIDQQYSTVIDPESETLRDFVLRHALMVPISSNINIEMGSADAVLKYTMGIKAVQNVQSHSLFPPQEGKVQSVIPWDPFRAMWYMTPLQRKLEYADPVGIVAGLTPNSLEDDRTTCLPSVVVGIVSVCMLVSHVRSG